MHTDYPDDNSLLNAIRTGDERAFRCLYDRYWDDLYKVANARVGNDQAQDIIQEIMVSVWKRKATIHTDAQNSLASYLFAAVKYRVIRYYAYTSAEVKNQEIFDIPGTYTAQQELEYRELTSLIEDHVNSLPPRMQQIFRMSREQDIPIANIAAQLNLSEQTVKNQLSEALKRLRAGLQSTQASDWAFMLTCFFWVNKS